MPNRAVHLRPEWPTPISCAAIDGLSRDARRLMDLIAITAAPSYERGRPVDHRWVDIMRLLENRRSMSVGKVSTTLLLDMETLQPILMKMTRRGLIQATGSAKSERKVELALTSNGKLEAERLVPLYDTIDSLTAYLVAVHAPNLAGELRALVEALEHEPFEDQLNARIQLSKLQKP